MFLLHTSLGPSWLDSIYSKGPSLPGHFLQSVMLQRASAWRASSRMLLNNCRGQSLAQTKTPMMNDALYIQYTVAEIPEEVMEDTPPVPIPESF